MLENITKILEKITKIFPKSTEFEPKKRELVKYLAILTGGLALGLKPEFSDAEHRNDNNKKSLQEIVDNHLNKRFELGIFPSDVQSSWYVKDLTTDEELVSINANIPMQTASMNKALSALAFLHKVAEGKIIYGPKSTKHMERMIQLHNDYSNVSANWVMKQAGGPQGVQYILKKYYGDIFQQTSITDYIPLDNNEWKIAKREKLDIPSGVSYYNNFASALDYARFFTALWDNELPYSREIKRLMALENKDRVKTWTNVREDTLVIDKTGTTARLIGNIATLAPKDKYGKIYPYILIGIIQKDSRANNLSEWQRSMGNEIRGVSNIVWDYMKTRHNF